MKSGTLLAQSVSQSVSQSVMPLIDRNPTVFRHTIGQAKCWREGGLAQIEYTGIITNSVMQGLAPQVVAFCGLDTALFRYDRATMTWPYQVDITRDVCLSGYGFWIVRSEHRLAARAHCLKLLAFGLRREVFPIGEILEAYHAAKIRASLVQRSRSKPCVNAPESLPASCQTRPRVSPHCQTAIKES